MEDTGPFVTVAVVLLACMASVIASVRWARSQTVADAREEIEASFATVQADLKGDFDDTVAKANINPTPDKVRFHGPSR